METGLLNFHDEEHFPVFCDDNNELVGESSIFNSFVHVFSEEASPWILPDNEIEFASFDPLESVCKEDYQRTSEEWQQHISGFDDNDRDIHNGSLSPQTPDDMPEIFGASISLPQHKVPDKTKVQTYKVAKRKGLVIKLTKEKSNVNCDKPNLNKSKKKLDVPAVNRMKLGRSGSLSVTKTELESDFEKNILLKDTSTENLSSFIKSEPNIINTTMPKIKIEKEDYLDFCDIFSEGPDFADNTFVKIKAEKLDSPYDELSACPLEPFGLSNFDLESQICNDNDIEQVKSDSPTGLRVRDMTLLEQFESSFNDDRDDKERCEIIIKPEIESKPVEEIVQQVQVVKVETVCSGNKKKEKPNSKKQNTRVPSNKSIMESFPKEVIFRIKESSQKSKKHVPLVPAEPLPTHDNEHLKDARTTPTKSLQLQISKQRSSGDSAQLDHDYCTSQYQHINKKIKEENSNAEWDKKWDSKKDSGLESGDVSDCSETLEKGQSKNSPTEPSFLETTVDVMTEEEPTHISAEPDETIDEEPKKKKLNLEEYRNRRKNAVPKSPIKFRNGGWKIPSPIKDNKKKSDEDNQIVNAEVQVQIDELKSDTKKDNTPGKRENVQSERLRRRSTSSTSSIESKSRYRRRGRSKRRRHSRGQRSYWSHSRSRSRSRSRSSSTSSSDSYSSSSSRSRSRSRGTSYRHHRSRSRSGYRRNSSHRYSSRHISKKRVSRRSDDWTPIEKMRQVEERRVIYVGRLDEGTTKTQLRERFSCFGPIVDISLHFREKGDNYGFVTFAYKVDAYEAVEHGNDYPLQPRYDICFGGRRAFCKQRYSDLDGTSPQSYSPHQQNSRSCDSFDNLLRVAQKRLKRSNNV